MYNQFTCIYLTFAHHFRTAFSKSHTRSVYCWVLPSVVFAQLVIHSGGSKPSKNTLCQVTWQRVLNLSFNLRAQICSWSKLPGCFNHQQKQNGTGLGAIHCWIQEFVATGVWKDCTSKRRRIITVTTIISTSILNRSQYCTWQPAWIWLANLVMSATL